MYPSSSMHSTSSSSSILQPHELDGRAVVDFIHVEGQLWRGGWVVGGRGDGADGLQGSGGRAERVGKGVEGGWSGG
jgi:hypothetical protein